MIGAFQALQHRAAKMFTDLELARFGYGTEALEREVSGLLPGIELLRLDSDVADGEAGLLLDLGEEEVERH